MPYRVVGHTGYEGRTGKDKKISLSGYGTGTTIYDFLNKISCYPSTLRREIFFPSEREIFINQQEITTLTVIWARQLVSPQPKLGPVP